jgi:hypothetical protein
VTKNIQNHFFLEKPCQLKKWPIENKQVVNLGGDPKKKRKRKRKETSNKEGMEVYLYKEGTKSIEHGWNGN